VLITYQHLASYRPLENGIAAQTKRKRTQIATTITTTLFQTFINGNIFTHFSKTNQQIGALCGSSAVDTQSPSPKPGMGMGMRLGLGTVAGVKVRIVALSASFSTLPPPPLTTPPSPSLFAPRVRSLLSAFRQQQSRLIAAPIDGDF